MKSIYRISCVIFLLTFFPLFTKSYALEVGTHEAIDVYVSSNSLDSFSLNTYLISNLGIKAGITEKFGTNAVWEWIRDGGYYEDKPAWTIPYLRSVNHFHNPITDEGFSGLFWGFILSGDSSIMWAQKPVGTQSPGGYYSWNDTRDYFHKALISNFKTTKDNYFAETFRGLGQLMHLVQDVSVPAHTRDDGHMLYDYEGYVDDIRGAESVMFQNLLSSPVFFGSTVNNISCFFDTNQYNGTNPNIAIGNTIGLSEYTNANFFSEDTIFSSSLTYPSSTSVQIADYAIADPRDRTKTVLRQYYKKTADGETGYRLATVGFLKDYIMNYIPWYRGLEKPSLDEGVYSDYAARLIPRAVGYSAGLLNYFFRGNIEITSPQSAVYSVANTDAGFFNKITLLAKNVTSTSEEMNNGSIVLVAKYRVAQEDPFQSKDILVSHDYFYTTVPEVNNVGSIPKDISIELTFDLGQTAIVPRNAVNVSLQVVFKGKLGSEDGAVAVGMKSISDPTPVDIVNNMDKICLYGAWYEAGSPEAIAQVDPNQDGIPGWDVYPHNIENTYVKMSPLTTPINASPTDYTLFMPLMQPGYLYRGYILSDIELNHSEYATAVKTTPDDTWTHAEGGLMMDTWPGTAVKASIDTYTDTASCAEYEATAPCAIRRSPDFYPFRGMDLWGSLGVVFDNPEYPVGSECSWEEL